MQLESRKRRILAAVIERYVESSEPVGSQTLAEELNLGIRPATIRNEFAELEELRLLTQPHTSAGRVPTDRGYRLYVDEILQPMELDRNTRSTVRARLQHRMSAIEGMLETACEVLAQVTDYPAVISIPAVSRDSVKHVQIGNVDSRKVLVVVYTRSGHVEHRLFDVPETVPATRINRVMRILNERLKGRSIASIRKLSEDDLLEPGEIADSFLRDAIRFVKETLAGQTDDRVLVEGIVTILSEPEFSDIEKARNLILALNEESLLNRVLDIPMRSGEVTVVIGQEHPVPRMRDLSFVGVPYRAGTSMLGGVGVFGPTRMKYWKVLPAVEQVAISIGECLNEMIA